MKNKELRMVLQNKTSLGKVFGPFPSTRLDDQIVNTELVLRFAADLPYGAVLIMGIVPAGCKILLMVTP